MTKVQKKSNMLTKGSDENEIKAYFNAILEMAQGGEEFPAELNMVWPLAYGQKYDAVNALIKEFIEGVDYQVFRQNPENPQGGRPTNDYKLSISCLEYFIARKIRAIFEVYRQVFHHKLKPINLDAITRKDLALMLVESEEEKEKLQRQIKEQAPKVLFADAVNVSNTCILIGEFAKILKQNGIDIGQNRLFEWLRANGYLIKRHGSDYNTPTQQAMDLGLFEIKETVITHSDGHISVSKTTKLTGKGQIYFVDKFLNNDIAA